MLAAIGAAVLTAGCGSSSSTGSGQSAAVSLKRAAYVSTASPGYKLAMTMHETVSGQSSGGTAIDLAANGSFSPGSRMGQMTMSMKGQVNGGTKAIDIAAVLDGETMYMKFPPSLANQLPGGKPWISINFAELGKAAGVSGLGSMLNGSSTLSDPGQYLDYLRAASDGSVKDLGQETVNGVQTTHYRADVDFKKLPNAVPAGEKQAAEQLLSTLKSKGVNGQMPVDAWIDASHYIRRLHMTYTVSLNGQAAAMDLTENLSDYGPQAAPTIPSPDQTTDLMSLINGSPTQGA